MGKSTSKLTMSYVKQEDVLISNNTGKTIPQRLEYYAKESPDKEAFVFVSTEEARKAVTFRELYDKSLQIARAFIKLGIQPTDYIGISLRTCPEWLYVAFGAMIAGGRPFGAHFTYKDGSDFVAMIEQLKTCTCVVMDPGSENENWNIISKLIETITPDGKVTSKQIPSVQQLLSHRPGDTMVGVPSVSELLYKDYGDTEFPEIHEDDIAFLFKTSGSTGIPKLVAHSQRSITSSLDFDGTEEFFNKDDIYFSDRPFEWLGGFPNSVLIGQTRITCSGFCAPPENKAKFVVDIIREEKCTIIVGFPSILTEMVKRKDEFPKSWQARGVFTGGLPITKQIFTGFESISKRFIIGYGASEHFVVNINVVDDFGRFIDYNCGPVVPGSEVRVVDEAGNIVPIGTRGEIYVKTKRMFSGYVNDVESTSAVLDKDGWYKTDDVGQMLENGSLLIEGRKSNVIISDGFNIIPEILENVIAKCPGVVGVVLVPVPDEKMYQVVCACVKIAKGSAVDENKLRKFCEEAHGDKQGLFTVLPKYYMIVDHFPMTSSGKIERKNLAELATKTFKNRPKLGV